jgi:hypothetical protein
MSDQTAKGDLRSNRGDAYQRGGLSGQCSEARADFQRLTQPHRPQRPSRKCSQDSHIFNFLAASSSLTVFSPLATARTAERIKFEACWARPGKSRAGELPLISSLTSGESARWQMRLLISPKHSVDWPRRGHRSHFIGSPPLCPNHREWGQPANFLDWRRNCIEYWHRSTTLGN